MSHLTGEANIETAIKVSFFFTSSEVQQQEMTDYFTVDFTADKLIATACSQSLLIILAQSYVYEA